MKCPNCGSFEVGDMRYGEEISEQLEMNKCHECSCEFLVIIFREGNPEMTMQKHEGVANTQNVG